MLDVRVLDLGVLGPPIEPALEGGLRRHGLLQQTPAGVRDGIRHRSIHIAIDAPLDRAETLEVAVIVKGADTIVDRTAVTRIEARDLF